MIVHFLTDVTVFVNEHKFNLVNLHPKPWEVLGATLLTLRSKNLPLKLKEIKM